MLRVGIAGDPASATSDEVLPVLSALALLCVVGLTLRDHPSVAWLAALATTLIATIDMAMYGRTVRAATDSASWQWLVLGVCLSALLGSLSAAAYANGRPRLPRPAIRFVSGVGIAVVAVASIAAVATASDPIPVPVSDSLGNVRLVTRAVLVIVPLLAIIGVMGDVLPPAERATKRVALVSGSSAPRFGAWLRAFADEVGPGRKRARRAVLDERSSIARDLHADVVPALRRALADADRGVPAEQLAAALRQVLAEVESVGASRHAIQLEIGGLIAALEWLAEQVEARSDVTVTLEIVDGPPSAAGSPPPDVAAAAFRVAGLALDNVVRHAPGSRVTVSVAARPEVVDLAIRDDGPGLSSDAVTVATAQGRRGILDMAAEAAACGADVRVSAQSSGRGTVVGFEWKSPKRPLG